MSATERPWTKVEPCGLCGGLHLHGRVTPEEHDGEGVATAADLALILRAVNAFDPMVKALGEVESAFNALPDDAKATVVCPDGRGLDLAASAAESLKLMRQVLNRERAAFSRCLEESRTVNAALAEALEEALNGWAYAAPYKGEYLAEKHGDAEDIARLRDVLQKARKP